MQKMSNIWMQCFNCCMTEQPQPKRRRRIDPSMIGAPTNFQHTGHIGAGDMQSGGSHKFSAIQDQMCSKGGYEFAVPGDISITVGDYSK